MKTSLATTLSIVGVLVTGGVALAVNTKVLDSTVSSIEGPLALAEAIVPGSAVSVDTTLTVDSTVPAETVAATPETTAVAESVQSAAASIQSAYDVQGVGIITLKQSVTGLDVVEVKPVSGWFYEVENERANRIEIKFSSGTQRVRFNAELLDGRIITSVQATDTAVAQAPNGNGNDDEEGEVGGDDD